MNKELEKFASYNVLARKALIFGVPILTLISFLGTMLLTGALGIAFWGFPKGIIIPLLLGVGLFVVRVKCMDDSRAMEDVVWDIKGAMARLRCRSTVTSFTSIDESDKNRRERIHEFYKFNNLK